jgi:hypothetical protein
MIQTQAIARNPVFPIFPLDLFQEFLFAKLKNSSYFMIQPRTMLKVTDVASLSFLSLAEKSGCPWQPSFRSLKPLGFNISSTGKPRFSRPLSESATFNNVRIC